MRVIRTALLPAAALVTALALAGCTSGGGDTLSYEDSPLNTYLASAWGGEIEELTAACMKEAGFEYVPNLQNGGTIVGDDGVWQPDKREWVAQYGYGVFNNPYNEQQNSGSSEEYVDPNQDYVSSLSESEQTAFYATLYGEGATEEQANDPDFDWSTLDNGCQGEASDQVYGSSSQQDIYTEYEDLLNRISEVYTSVQSSAELKALDKEWASCMADAGFSGYTAQSEPTQKMYDVQNALYEDQNSAYEDFDYENATEAELEAFYAANDPTTTPEWKQHAEEEIEIALADFDCREKLDYTNQSLRLQFAAEEKFIADNKAELEAFRAAAEQANG